MPVWGFSSESNPIGFVGNNLPVKGHIFETKLGLIIGAWSTLSLELTIVLRVIGDKQIEFFMGFAMKRTRIPHFYDKL